MSGFPRRPSRSPGSVKELRGLSALEAWARKVTTGYKDVKITDLSSSFKNGLAFCAVICYHRPDLIDFDSLSKENVYYNNKLAFTVAEQHLGVPALLDAEDFLNPDLEPDRASIATYLSTLYERFNGKNRTNGTTNGATNIQPTPIIASNH